MPRDSAGAASVAVAAETAPTRSGHPTLKVRTADGKAKFLHSPVDPVKEASRLVEKLKIDGPGLVICFGLGLGYHVADLRARHPDLQVVVVEPRREVVEAARRFGPCKTLEEDPKVDLLVAPTAASMRETLKNRTLEVGKVYWLIHPQTQQLDPEGCDQLLKAARDAASINVTTASTFRYWKNTWVKTSFENLEFVLSSPDVGVLFDAFKGVPGILISAGPSLDKNIDLLRQAEDKAVLVCVGTALRKALAHGVTPHLVISLDSGRPNWRHFDGLDYSHIPLVFEPMVHPNILAHHHGRKAVGATENLVYQWLEPIIGERARLAAGGSVANTALDLLYQFGCDPIVFVGQDLAFSREGFTHASGTRAVRHMSDTNPATYVEVPGIDGEPVVALRTWHAFLHWFNAYIESQSDRHYIDATEGGARIDGTEIAPLAEVLSRFATVNPPIRETIERKLSGFEPNPDWPGQIRSTIREMLATMSSLRRAAEEAARLATSLLNLAQQGRLQSSAHRRIVRKLGALNEELREYDFDDLLLNYVMQLPNLRAIHIEKDTANIEDEQELSETVARRSLEYYEAIQEAAKASEELLEEAIERLAGAESAAQNA